MLSLRKLRGLSQFRRLMSKAVKGKEEPQQPTKSWKPPGKAQPSSEDDGTDSSFVKNFFLGKFDAAILTYPEILEKERHEWFHSTLAPIQKFFNEKVDTKAIDSEGKIPENILKGLRTLGLFGQEVPVDYGGLEFCVTENCRVNEVVGYDPAIGITLSSHQAFAVKSLLVFGTEYQKKKYLPRLASGEDIAAFCLTEETSGSDIASMKTKARLSTDGKSWTLNGKKIMVTNGDKAEIFIVLAKTADDSVAANSAKRLTAFIVERKFGGVTSSELKDKLGVRGSSLCNVSFDNLIVPSENVVGKIGDGFEVAAKMLDSSRLTSSCLALGLLKKMIDITTNYAINREQFGKSISEHKIIREKIGRMTVAAYTMESMIYLTAGIIDSNTYADTSIETAILKVFSSEGCWEGVNECLQIFGGNGYMKDSICETAVRDARLYLVAEQTNEILRLYIASMGVQFSGQALRDFVIKIRNPLQFPGLALKKTLERVRHSHNTLKLNLRLREYVHPTLANTADLLEGSAQRMKFVVEQLLGRHGADLVNAQLELKRIADITIDLYAMSAVLSRSSRSYCIGLRNADTEIAIAEAFCAEATQRVSTRTREIEDGEYCTTDNSLMRIADDVFTNKGYFPAHPLARNFW